jgi:hypothetical protein
MAICCQGSKLLLLKKITIETLRALMLLDALLAGKISENTYKLALEQLENCKEN